MTVQEMDRLVITKTVEVLIAAGAVLSVDDGGEGWAVRSSTDKNAIVEAVTAVDDCMLSVRGADAVHGWVRFVLGNDGYDVINDHSARLEETLAPVFALCDELEEGHYHPRSGCGSCGNTGPRSLTGECCNHH